VVPDSDGARVPWGTIEPVVKEWSNEKNPKKTQKVFGNLEWVITVTRESRR